MQRGTWRRLVVAFGFALGIGVVVAVGGVLIGGCGDLIIGSVVGAAVAAFLVTYLALGQQNIA